MGTVVKWVLVALLVYIVYRIVAAWYAARTAAPASGETELPPAGETDAVAPESTTFEPWSPAVGGPATGGFRPTTGGGRQFLPGIKRLFGPLRARPVLDRTQPVREAPAATVYSDSGKGQLARTKSGAPVGATLPGRRLWVR